MSTPGSDAELLNTVRSGDPGAFDVLRARHEAAARRLAGLVSDGPEAADALVASAFSQALADITRGGGLSDAFRPCLLAAIAGRPPAAADSPVLAAFLALPERWQAVLWHADVEEDPAEVIAPLVGLAAADVPALADRVRDGLDREYRQLQPAGGPPWPGGVASALRREVAPAFLGAASAGYLAGRPGATGPAGTAGAAGLRRSSRSRALILSGAAVVVAVIGITGYLVSLGPASRPVATAGLPGRAASGPGPASASAKTHHRGGATARRPGTGRRRGSAPGAGPSVSVAPGSPAPGPTGLVTSRPPTSRPPTTRPPTSGPPTTPPPTLPRPTPSSGEPSPRPKSGPAGRVTAQISVSGGAGDLAMVLLGVANGGPGATSDLTASVALPSGAALLTAWPGPPGIPGSYSLLDVLGTRFSSGGEGWVCGPASGGAACTHPALPAAAQAGTLLTIHVTSSAACGQHVQVTVTGGAATASAESGGTIECRRSPVTATTTRKTTRTRHSKGPGGQRPAPTRRHPSPGGGWPGHHHRHWPWPSSPPPGWPHPSRHWPYPSRHWHWPDRHHHRWPWPGY